MKFFISLSCYVHVVIGHIAVFRICRWFSVSSGSKYSDYFRILHTVHFILGENGVGLFLRNAENTLVFRVDVLEAELISMKKVLLFS